MTDPKDMSDDIHARLTRAGKGRVGAPRLKDGVLSLVLDVTGMTDVQREVAEAALRAELRGAAGVTEVRIAMTQERGPAPDAPESAAKPPRRIPLIAVGSGKGGVGKSTVSANLAVALTRLGKKVGLVDADIYGPSQPRLMGNAGERPVAQDKQLIPVPSKWGVPVLSMGHLSAPGQAIAWRGPMAGNALGQLVDAQWGDVDLLIVDLPPGTGDIQLSMVQKHKPAGAIIVSTPQDLALIDAARAISLFDQAHVPVIGMVENMAGYICPHCGEMSDPFGAGGAEAAATEMKLPFLGRIPLDIVIRRASDDGAPPAAGGAVQAEPFLDLAAKLVAWLGRIDIQP